MIKRLKWNVLYGESGEDDSDWSDASDGSDGSTERGSTNVQAVLDQLVRNDSKLASIVRMGTGVSSSGEEDEGNSMRHVLDTSTTLAGVRKETSDDCDEAEYAEWRECELCPGKRFLNDAEVELHLRSKRHRKAVRRTEALSATEHRCEKTTAAEGTIDDDILVPEDVEYPTQDSRGENDTTSGKAEEQRDVGFPVNMNNKEPVPTDQKERLETTELKFNAGCEITEDQRWRAEKRKAAVKRKLKALKRRKWEKKLKLEKTKDCVEDRKETQKGSTWDDGKDLGPQSRQHTKKKSCTRRKKKRDVDLISERVGDTGDGEKGLSTLKENKITRKERTMADGSRTQKETDESQRKKPKQEKAGNKIATDGAKRIRQKKLK